MARRRRSRRKSELRMAAFGLAFGAALAAGALPSLVFEAVLARILGPFTGTIASGAIRAGARSASAAAPRGQIIGTAKVIDGDTIDVTGIDGQIRVRLRALHSPERHQRGGSQATAAMNRLVGGKTVTCVPDGTMTHGRTVADCRTHGGKDVAGTLIASGVAAHCERFGRADLERVERRTWIWLSRPSYCRRK